MADPRFSVWYQVCPHRIAEAAMEDAARLADSVAHFLNERLVKNGRFSLLNSVWTLKKSEHYFQYYNIWIPYA